MITRDDILPQIAFKHLGIPTLQERKSDGLDFHTVAVWSVKAALEAAFEEGQWFGAPMDPQSSTVVPFDGYEIHPVRSFGEKDKTGRQPTEVCEPNEAECWSLYGHIPGQGVDCIGDYQTRAHAEEILARITGRPIPVTNLPAAGDKA